jgi:hypothetical protein
MNILWVFRRNVKPILQSDMAFRITRIKMLVSGDPEASLTFMLVSQICLEFILGPKIQKQLTSDGYSGL